MKNTKNYEAPVAEMIEMQAPSVLMSSDNTSPGFNGGGDIELGDDPESF
jgi:hypothetical protein